MNKTEELKPCPFCGGVAKIVVSDDEGNDRNEEYEQDPWSGLSFRIQHHYESNKDCPIALYKEDGGGMGVHLYDSREEVVNAWNTRSH